jgi:hypothetical protein
MISSKNMENLLWIAIVSFIFILSFRAFAPYLAPNLNSDNAIHILMAYHLKLPDDLYYWGQDRLGSIVPILGHFLLKLLPLSPVEAVSYVQYFLLLVGFLCFASLFRNPISKIAFALIWFLPLRVLTELIHIGQPYGAQLAFIGVGIVLINYLIENTEQLMGWRRRILIAIATTSLFISLWISDFTIITILLLALMLLVPISSSIFKEPQPVRNGKLVAIAPDVLTILVVSLMGFLSIDYAKQNAADQGSYSGFNGPAQVIEVLSRLGTSLIRTISFQAKTIFLSIHAILTLVFIGYAVYLLLRSRNTNIQSATSTTPPLKLSRWFYFFLAHTILGLVLLVLSDWVYKNGINFRYFTPVYITGWLAALLFTEALDGAVARRASVLLVLAAVSSSFSLPRQVFFLEKPEPKIQTLQEIQTLGNAGLIGDYWTAYLICSANPASLNCTPYDRKGTTPCLASSQPRAVGQVRCRRCVPKVMASETIYLVKEKWLDAFPDQIQQFGQCLIRVGQGQKLGGYTMAPYQKRSP